MSSGRSTVLPSESQNRRASASDASRAAQPSAPLEADEAASLDDEFMCTDRAAYLEKIARSAAAPGYACVYSYMCLFSTFLCPFISSLLFSCFLTRECRVVY